MSEVTIPMAVRIEILRRLESARNGLADARELINERYPVPTEATKNDPPIVGELGSMVERVQRMISNFPIPLTPAEPPKDE